MRISIACAALIAAPVLLLTACGSNAQSAAIRGTVADKEYEPAKTKKIKVAVHTTTCSKPKKVKVDGKITTKKNCTTKTTYKTRTKTVKKECYELDIRLSNGTETEVCDQAAFYALIPDDPYNSTTDYSKKARR